MPDPIAVLKQDHRSVEKLFERFESTGDTEVALRICQELRLHAALEEELVYPLIQDRVDGEMAARARDDHSKAKQLVNRVERWRVVDGGLRDLVTELKKVVLEHVEEEEMELFPKMARQISGDRLNRLGEELAQRRPVTISDVEAAIRELKSGVNRLSRRTMRAVVDELESMTKAELQAYAEETDIADVDEGRQTKEEMIQTIRRGIAN